MIRLKVHGKCVDCKFLNKCLKVDGTKDLYVGYENRRNRKIKYLLIVDDSMYCKANRKTG